MALTRIGLNQSINLASNVTGTLPVANGGTALTSGFVNGGVNTPNFRAYLSASGISMSSSTDTTCIFDAENYDTASAYNTSNGRFTIPSGQAGKYFLSACIRNTIDSTNNSFDLLKTMIFQYNSSDSLVLEINNRQNAAFTNKPTGQLNGIFNCSVGDYFLVKQYINDSGHSMVSSTSGNATWFYGYKIIE